jgi:hypothetical protein
MRDVRTADHLEAQPHALALRGTDHGLQPVAYNKRKWRRRSRALSCRGATSAHRYCESAGVPPPQRVCGGIFFFLWRHLWLGEEEETN